MHPHASDALILHTGTVLLGDHDKQCLAANNVNDPQL